MRMYIYISLLFIRISDVKYYFMYFLIYSSIYWFIYFLIPIGDHITISHAGKLR